LLNVPPTHTTGRVFAVPPRSLVAIGVVLFCAALVEGSMADWTAVYLKTSLLTTESFATIGYAAFSLAMLAGRLTGDVLKARLGAVALGRSGGLIATLGMAFALVIGQPWASLIGFACVGWGVSSLFPMAFSAAGNAKGVNQGVALASIATMGYTGFLVGPPLIGFIAQATGLRLALAVVVVLSLVIAFGSSTLKASESSP
jgi:MFS family permease